MGIKDGLQKLCWSTLAKFGAVAFFGVWSLGFAWTLLAQPAGQKTFSSPDEASKALFLAVRSGNEKDLLEIFGADGKEIISSGDPAEDQKSRATFAEKYQRMNRLVAEPDGTVRLYVGAENWPMPIPLVNQKITWYFDTSAGKEEILFRRIGRNEIATIRVLQELVAAQKEYYSKTMTTMALNSTRRSSSACRESTTAFTGMPATVKRKVRSDRSWPMLRKETELTSEYPVSGLLLPGPDEARRTRIRRRQALSGPWQDDARLCVLGLSCSIRQLGHHVVWRRSRWNSLSERSRPGRLPTWPTLSASTIRTRPGPKSNRRSRQRAAV